MAGMIAKAETGLTKKKPQTVTEYVRAYENQIAKALPKVMTPERFTRMVLSALNTNEKLKECDVRSFLGAMMCCAQLGLEPNTPLGQAYLIPFRNNKKGITECQFQIGYKGLLDLAYRSGEIKTISAHVVYANDEFEYEYGLNETLRHKPAMKDRGEAVYVYALFKLKNGGEAFEVMSVADAMAHGRKYSKSFNNSPWQTDPEAMMLKTVIKRVLKYAPLKSDFVQGASADEKTMAFDAADEQPEVIVINAETGEVIDEGKADE